MQGSYLNSSRFFLKELRRKRLFQGNEEWHLIATYTKYVITKTNERQVSNISKPTFVKKLSS